MMNTDLSAIMIDQTPNNFQLVEGVERFQSQGKWIGDFSG